MRRELWERNLKAMEKWYPDFVDMIREKQDVKDDTEVILEQSQDGETIFRIRKEEQLLYLSGKRNAGKPIEMWLERMGKTYKYAPVFLFGLGNGAYLKALINSTAKEVNVIVYEPSINIFFTALQEIDLSKEIEERPIGFIVEELNAEEFVPVLNKVLVLENLEFLKQEIHPNYKELYAEKILEKVRQIQRKTEGMIVNYNTGKKFSTHLANNVLSNLQYICEGYHTQALAEAVMGKGAAILVSAGPSLNKNIQELKKAKNKCFILAVDTAIKPLIKAGIVPDAFTTIDVKKPLMLTDIKGSEYIPVIAPTCANHQILERQKGKKIFYNDGYRIPVNMYLQNGKMLPSISMGGSVACSSLSLLYKMGFKTIILVGQDLAYTDNKSHADGTFQDKMPEENTENMIKVKGNYVDKIPTKENFRMFIEWFNDYIKGIREHSDVRIVNATEGGAYLEGTELCTLKDILEEVCGEEINYEEKINGMKAVFSKEEKEKAIAYLHNIPKEYEEIWKAAKELEKTYVKLEKLSKSGNIVQGNTGKLLKKVKRLTKKCQEKDVYQLIDMTMTTADYIIRNEYYYEYENVEEEIKEVIRNGVLYSRLLQQCAELLKELAESKLESI